MKSIEKYSNKIFLFLLVIAGIALYKTFDNITVILSWFGVVFKSLTPFIIGFVIAYILNIPSKKIDALLKKSKYKFISKMSRGISIFTVYFVALVLLYIVMSAIAPALYRNFIDLYNNIPRYADDIITRFSQWQRDSGIVLFEFNEQNVADTINKILGRIDISEFSKYAKGVINVTSGFFNIIIGIIISVYMLIDKEKIKKGIKRVMKLFIKKDPLETIVNVVRRTNAVFSKYFFCLIIDAVIMAVLSTIVLSLLKVKYAIILGCMIGLFNLIPYFGAIIAVALTIIITLISGGLAQAIWVTVMLIVIQQIDSNFIGPKIMGQMLDTSPLLIIFAITLGGGLFGVGGMIVSVPLFIVLKMLISDFIDERELKKSEQ